MKKIQYNQNKNVISRQLRANRAKAGISQGELAARLQLMNVNIDQQMISKIENNTRMVTDYELACLCKVLKVEVQEMLSDFYHDLE